MLYFPWDTEGRLFYPHEGIPKSRRDTLVNKERLASFLIVQVKEANAVLPCSTAGFLSSSFAIHWLCWNHCITWVFLGPCSAGAFYVDKSDIDSIISEILYDPDRGFLLRLTSKFSIFFETDGAALGVARDFQHTLATGEKRPLRQSRYRVFLSEIETINSQVDTMVSNHTIQPSTSPWLSPVELVRMKGGSISLCVDY